MHSLSGHDPLRRFDGRADIYARHRPDYPAAAVEFIITSCGLGPQSLLVDVGCGTGISSRQFAAAGIPVLGIEPNDQMRTQAEQALLILPSPPPRGRGVGGTPTPLPRKAGGEGLSENTAHWPAPRYQSGRAEATGLPDGSAAAVLAAQAFHWFEVEPTLREFQRILKPAGWVALMWNERDESDAFTRAYGDIIRASPDTALVEGTRARSGAALLSSPLFHAAQRVEFSHAQFADEDGLLGRALSTSYVSREPTALEQITSRLRNLFAHGQQDGQVRLLYRTSVYLAQK